MFSLAFTSTTRLNKFQMWHRKKVRCAALSLAMQIPYLHHLSNHPMTGNHGLLPCHSQLVVPKKVRRSLLRELNSHSTYELHIQAHKAWQTCFHAPPTECVYWPSPEDGSGTFNVFMGWQTFQYYLTTKWVPDNTEFYYPSTSQHRRPRLSQGYAVPCSQHGLKVAQVLSRQEPQNDTTFSKLAWNQWEGKKKTTSLFHYNNNNITKRWMQARGCLPYQPVTKICG